jgi:Bacteriophage tail sheath protein
MTEYLAPGVYVEEVAFGSKPIEGVTTSTTAFVGAAQSPRDPVLLTSFTEFEREIGAASVPGFLAEAVRGFFNNEGKRCYVVLGSGRDPICDALDGLERKDVSMLCCPDEHQFADAGARIAEYCERRQDVIGLLSLRAPLPDPSNLPVPRSSYVACYYPWIVVRALDGTMLTMPPAGHICGVYARTDRDRGVHTSPDGAVLDAVVDVSHEVSPAEADALATHGVNVVRRIPNHGIRLSGARTPFDRAELTHVHVRRLLIFIEQSIIRGTRWVVFERNDPLLWANVRRAIEDFLLSQWKHGALVGPAADAAFFVHCDRSTMTQADLDAGQLVAVVGMAVVKPAEYVMLRIRILLDRRCR